MKKLYIAVAILIGFAITEGCRKQNIDSNKNTAAAKVNSNE
jgi:hypothetical protein